MIKVDWSSKMMQHRVVNRWARGILEQSPRGRNDVASCIRKTYLNYLFHELHFLGTNRTNMPHLFHPSSAQGCYDTIINPLSEVKS